MQCSRCADEAVYKSKKLCRKCYRSGYVRPPRKVSLGKPMEIDYEDYWNWVKAHLKLETEKK